MERLGRAHYITTQLWARAAPAMAEFVNADQVVRIWAAQDSLFSSYPFGSNHKDTEMADLLCRQSVDVARMLEELRRYDEALAVVSRGMAYGKTKDALMQATVYASFYTYRAGKAREAIALATEAAGYGPLAGNLKARAQHVIGLSYFSLFEDSSRVGDLEASIKALNDAVTIDPSMSEARQMLQTLREHRERLSSTAS
jgi:tetratricopeptide (TPR) repeat protein